MFRGFIFGVMWGGLFGGAVLALLSLISEVPGQKPPRAAVDAPVIEAIPTNPDLVPGPLEVSPSEALPNAESAAQPVPVDEGVTQSELSSDVTSPGRQPTPVIETSPFASVPGNADTDIAQTALATPETPVFPSPQVVIPNQPSVETVEAAPLEPNPSSNVDEDLRLADAPEADAAEPAQEDANVAVTTPTLEGLPETAESVTVGRLPSIGQDSADTPTTGADLPPVQKFATPAEVDPEKPLMAVVMLDDPSRVLGPSFLASLSVPVTLAIDAATPDAAERAQEFRTAGFEVVLAANLPAQATPSDIEGAFNFFFSAVPEAVAILDTTGTGFRGDRSVIDAVNTILDASGHGLVTYDQGLNAAAQTAQSLGIPVATIGRDLDSRGQDAAVIRRFLSQAAFDARQNEQVVVLARLRPDTVTALIQWAQQPRAQGLNIVPVSAILNQ